MRTEQGESSDDKYSAAGYDRVEPKATYAPWTTDADFLRVNEVIREHTLVDRYRCYELWSLVPQAMKAPGDLLEVGVWRGGTGALIAAAAEAGATTETATQAGAEHRAEAAAGRRIDTSRAGDRRTVYLADTFTGVVKAGPKDRYYKGGEHANTSVSHVQSVLDSLSLHNTCILEGVFPDDTADGLEDSRFCFCHIDVDVYQGARDVTEWVLPRLSPGAIIVYDDYGFYGCEGVTEYVESIASHPSLTFVHNLNGHAIFIRTG